MALLEAEPTARVLIIRFSAMGDIIQLSAFVEYLKRRWPGCNVGWITKAAFAPLVERMPAVDRVWAYHPATGLKGLRTLAREASARGCDLLCDMHAVPRSLIASSLIPARITIRYRKPYLKRAMLFYLHRNLFPGDYLVTRDFLRVLAPCGDVPDWYGTRLTLRDEDRAKAASVLAGGSVGGVAFTPSRFQPCVTGPFVAFVVGAAWPQKRWPTAHFIELGRLLAAEHGLTSVVLGGPADDHCDVIASGIGAGAVSLRGVLDLPAALGVIEQAALIVGNDTGLMHGAEAVGRQVAVLLGPTARETGAYPWRPGSLPLEVMLPCRPCSQKGDRPCQLARQECLLQLTPRRVLRALAPLLKRYEQITRQGAEGTP